MCNLGIMFPSIVQCVHCVYPDSAMCASCTSAVKHVHQLWNGYAKVCQLFNISVNCAVS